MKQFKGRVIVAGACEAEALVSHGGFNTLASYHKKPMMGKALCLPQTIGSTTGGMVLFSACSMHLQPACMLFSMHIDPLAASGAVLGKVWTDASMPVVDQLGDEFLNYVQTGDRITVSEDGTVTVDR